MPHRRTDKNGEVAEPVIRIDHNGPLEGEVRVPGAKNSVLKLMAATVLADGEFVISNVPGIVDVEIMSQLLRSLGSSVEPVDGDSLLIRHEGDLSTEVPAELAGRLRASINLLGPLVARFSRIQIALPGGDDFGLRPIDMHISGLESMGATCHFAGGVLTVHASRLRGANIRFSFPSVGATENLVTAAIFADGVTTIDGAAREPEVVDLCRFLVAMGADIEGIGESTLRITGVPRGALHSASHRVVPDRIQAATYVASVAVAGGEVDMIDAQRGDMEMFLRRCTEMGLVFTDLDRTGLRVASSNRLRAVDVQTLPFPGVATDYKPLVIAMLSVANGSAVVTENLYPGRFKYVDELVALGANITMHEHHAEITGVSRLSGTNVIAHDIRAGAALVVAGLAADGVTTIGGVGHIDRGYDDLVGRLRGIGAGIRRD
ncbi:MAG: UDP-N-acetylglucosamine 1-carboxyvinyltransferase [Ilumatobacteraceae bacterium]